MDLDAGAKSSETPSETPSADPKEVQLTAAFATLPEPSDKPFFLWLVNPSAGGQSGAGIMSNLRREYEAVDPAKRDGAIFSVFGDKSAPEQEGKFEEREGLYFNWFILDLFAKVQRPLRVVAAGGDGTVVWIINALSRHPAMMERLASKGNVWGPVVAVQALGTGNDMCRFLRWGTGLGSAGELDHDVFLKQCGEAELFEMDRWKLTIDPPPKDTTAFGKKNSTTFVNYFSIGVDGKIATDFEACRGCCPSCFCCPCINKCWYGYHGAKCSVACYSCCTKVEEVATVKADGKDITGEIDAASVVCCNISSYGAGLDLWTMPSGKTAEMPGEHDANDGKLEMVGVSKAGDLGMARVSECCVGFDRLAQPEAVELDVSEPVHMQVDGEAWLMEEPCKVTIQRDTSIWMLRCKPE